MLANVYQYAQQEPTTITDNAKLVTLLVLLVPLVMPIVARLAQLPTTSLDQAIVYLNVPHIHSLMVVHALLVMLLALPAHPKHLASHAQDHFYFKELNVSNHARVVTIIMLEFVLVAQEDAKHAPVPPYVPLVIQHSCSTQITNAYQDALQVNIFHQELVMLVNLLVLLALLVPHAILAQVVAT